MFFDYATTSRVLYVHTVRLFACYSAFSAQTPDLRPLCESKYRHYEMAFEVRSWIDRVARQGGGARYCT